MFSVSFGCIILRKGKSISQDWLQFRRHKRIFLACLMSSSSFSCSSSSSSSSSLLLVSNEDRSEVRCSPLETKLFLVRSSSSKERKTRWRWRDRGKFLRGNLFFVFFFKFLSSSLIFTVSLPLLSLSSRRVIRGEVRWRKRALVMLYVIEKQFSWRK